ncbi:MAG: cytochrome b/b6 domain-containing protein [Actinomycetota bacterium]|nr:MAG: Hup-type Ni Fe-hydrogenase cytochrome b [Actinomycetota bacterium]MDO8950187.1 cytochrome b/b6 domain-containing protein [Actinomycetota bacterium]MDP3630028.1 cytochrome b/b6 domain-containing protein [Actinomycetota bacterium]
MSAILLANVNVWLDIIFVTLEILVFIVFFVVHLGVSIPTGRFRKQWIEKKWPKHDWRAPALPKLIHFQHLVMMLLLGLSGMYIRFPFFEGGRTAMRYVHYVAMVIVGINFLWRLWYAFYSKERDYKEFAIGKKDLATLLGVVAYYTYFSNDKPHVAKYNVMQKMAYDMFGLLMIAQGFTGLALLTQPFLFGTSPRELLIGWWLGPLVGGTAMAGAWIRVVHYAINWLFIIITTVHIYLAAGIDLPCTLDFFGLKKLETDPNAYHHDHDDDHDDHHADAPALSPAAAEAD